MKQKIDEIARLVDGLMTRGKHFMDADVLDARLEGIMDVAIILGIEDDVLAALADMEIERKGE